MATQQPICKNCGDSFHGRADKKFCSDHCRNSFNNKANSDSNNYVRNINNILRKNRRILEALNPNGKANVHKKQLEKEGFLFDYHTSIYTTKTGNVYFFCYEHGYLALDKGYYTLVVRKES